MTTRTTTFRGRLPAFVTYPYQVIFLRAMAEREDRSIGEIMRRSIDKMIDSLSDEDLHNVLSRVDPPVSVDDFKKMMRVAKIKYPPLSIHVELEEENATDNA